uniref:Nuclear transition protein 2 n=3 Tax=Rattus norvegicus TaxID=10116 RepID=A0ABZ3NNN2_RAT
MKCWGRGRRRKSLPLRVWPPMDTKMQSLPTTHPHPHSSSRPQSHTNNQCACSHHCRSCSQAGHPSSSSSPSSGPPTKHPKTPMHSRYSPSRPSHRGSCPKNRKTLEGKVSKRKAVRRRKRTHRAKRRSSGRRYK